MNIKFYLKMNAKNGIKKLENTLKKRYLKKDTRKVIIPLHF